MSQPVSLLSLATRTPHHRLSQDQALATARDLIGDRFADFDRLAPVFDHAGIAERQLAMPLDWYRTPRSFEERSAAYLDVALDLFVAAASGALAEAGLQAGDVDAIVTVSSTGIATPSLEARAMAHLSFRNDVRRVPVFGLGCAGGATGLALAADLARARPGTTVLFVTVELCSLALRTHGADKADLISTALFGDGAAACLLRTGDEGFAQIVGSAENTWNDTLDIMGWRTEQTGLAVVLNRAIPTFVERRCARRLLECWRRRGSPCRISTASSAIPAARGCWMRLKTLLGSITVPLFTSGQSFTTMATCPHRPCCSCWIDIAGKACRPALC